VATGSRLSLTRHVGDSRPVAKPSRREAMGNVVTSAVLVMTGAACVLVGYVLCAWRHRAQYMAEMDREELDSHQRVLDLIESMIDEEGHRRDNRPN
jgi:hypothetical protein